MATYYVRPDGNNANVGTGSAANQAWQTVTYALANMVLTNGANYLYIAPGVYRETPTVTITPSSTQTLVISGDPAASQFSGLTSGVVRLTNYLTDTTDPTTSHILTISSKTYITIENIFFEQYSTTGLNYSIRGASNPDYITIRKCVFSGQDNGTLRAGGITITTSGVINNIDITRCTFVRQYIGVNLESTASAGTTQSLVVTNTLFTNCDFCVYITGNGLGRSLYNCTYLFFARFGIRLESNQSSSTGVYNCLFYGGGTALGTSSVGITENFNRMISCTPRSNVSPSGANSQTTGVSGVDAGYGLLTGIAYQQMLSTIQSSPNSNFGTTSGAPVSDMYGVTWTGSNPDAGSATYSSLSAIGSYLPTERNTSSVTISPNATSKTIHLYLGATGLLFNTSGLSARYTRSGSNSVAISLVSQTSNGAWVSGGFAEIDAINQPGLYRLDVPNAAFVSGADRVTITVRGASGTNGAVVDCQLISSQLDLTQTIPTSNTPQTVGDALNAARAQGFGKWVVSGKTLNLYAPDGTTIIRSFTLNSATEPTSRT